MHYNERAMDVKKWISALGFTPKEHTVNTYSKQYPLYSGYHIDVDFGKKVIHYNEILSDSKTTQNFSHLENFVVLECVDRLLNQGYSPKSIILEKSYPAGRGSTKRLDILVLKEKTPYLMVECKTYGEEFDKELVKTQKDGGQLFTYFQQDTKAELLMLYASTLTGDKFVSEHRVIKIGDELRNAGSVKEAHAIWSGAFYETGFWGKHPYDFEQEKFTKEGSLRELNEAEGMALFNKFATILRRHSVSDKPNAFNKIFNLFLAKLYDEQKMPSQELEFHWRENDNPVDFQVRLFNLHKEGLRAFLDKELEGIYDSDFDGANNREELLEKKKKVLKINKIYDIKEVFDDDTFEQNHRVLKDVVKLLEQYQIRYPRKQRHLSEFFEQLLTTGLKQEAGQFFTPPTVTKFIVRSLPLPQLLKQEINQPVPSLPAALDYAAGSGHFITEILEEYQDIIENLNTSDFYPKAQKEVAAWKADPYSWAARYIYGIEKDYRLVKVAKVGCYFYGDGLAQIILGDGLDSFAKSKSYVGLLKKNAKEPQFSVLVSNPPYSVDGVKDDIEYIGAQKEFALYNNLTDSSSEIEALFVERTAQLLKEGGVAGIVLPNTILSNGGIYAKAREIILQNFDIIAIAQLGGNTFMATNTNTVVLFLRKRNNAEVARIKESVYRVAEGYAQTHEDPTINGVEKPVETYLARTGETTVNAEKFYYFILNYHTKTVIVKTGEKDAEKNFLGYRIIKRRGSEGYHAIQSGKTIDECTKLYDDSRFDNEEKASAYIFNAFNGTFPAIHSSLKENVFYVDLVDLLTFDRDNFDKNVSLAIKKKVKFDSLWGIGELVSLSDVADIKKGTTSMTKEKTVAGSIPVIAGGQDAAYYHNEANRDGNVITISASGAYAGFVNYHAEPIFASDCNTIKSKDESKILTSLIFHLLKSVQDELYGLQRGQAQPHVYGDDLAKIKIPLPAPDVQQKIVAEMMVLEQKEAKAKEEIRNNRAKIERLFADADNRADRTFRLSNDDVFDISIGKRVIGADLKPDGTIPVYSANVFEPFGYIDQYLITDFNVPSVLWGIDGDWMVNYIPANIPFYPTDHCGVLRVKSKDILPKFLAWVLNKEGLTHNFSRTLRASIDRIKGISIKVLSIAEQEAVVSTVQALENEIAKAQEAIDKIPAQKAAILKKYL